MDDLLREMGLRIIKAIAHCRLPGLAKVSVYTSSPSWFWHQLSKLLLSLKSIQAAADNNQRSPKEYSDD
jgi:hypothetical protein